MGICVAISLHHGAKGVLSCQSLRKRGAWVLSLVFVCIAALQRFSGLFALHVTQHLLVSWLRLLVSCFLPLFRSLVDERVRAILLLFVWECVYWLVVVLRIIVLAFVVRGTLLFPMK